MQSVPINMSESGAEDDNNNTHGPSRPAKHVKFGSTSVASVAQLQLVGVGKFVKPISRTKAVLDLVI